MRFQSMRRRGTSVDLDLGFQHRVFAGCYLFWEEPLVHKHPPRKRVDFVLYILHQAA